LWQFVGLQFSNDDPQCDIKDYGLKKVIQHFKQTTKISKVFKSMVDSVMQSSTYQFLDAFSNLVTKHSFSQTDWLARTGSYSIYALLSQIIPEVRAASC
jgi:hypothetical protein